MKKAAKRQKSKEDKTKQLLSALPYLLWPVAVMLVIIEETKEKKDKLLRHHGYNAIGFIAGVLILSIPVWILNPIPVFGDILASLYWFGVVLLALMFALKAYKGKKVIVPFTTDFMKNNIKDF